MIWRIYPGFASVCAAFVGVVIATGPASAQDRSAVLAGMTAYLPETVLEGEQAIYATFHDLQASAHAAPRSPYGALAALIGDGDPWARYMRLVDFPPDIGAAISKGVEGEWEAHLAFAPSDISALVSMYSPPAGITAMRMDGRYEIDAMAAALQSNGYSPRAVNAWRGWMRGEDDLSLDLAASDPSDPFGGILGRASRVAAMGDVVLQSASWPPIDAVTQGDHAPAFNGPYFDAALAAIDDVRFGAARLVQAVLLPRPVFSDTPGALPQWRVAIMADISDGRTDTGLIAVVYDDRATAEALVADMSAAWDTSRARQSAGGEAEVFVIGEEPAALALVVSRDMSDDEDEPRNLVYHAMTRSLWMMDMTILLAQ